FKLQTNIIESDNDSSIEDDQKLSHKRLFPIPTTLESTDKSSLYSFKDFKEANSLCSVTSLLIMNKINNNYSVSFIDGKELPIGYSEIAKLFSKKDHIINQKAKKDASPFYLATSNLLKLVTDILDKHGINYVVSEDNLIYGDFDVLKFIIKVKWKNQNQMINMRDVQTFIDKMSEIESDIVGFIVTNTMYSNQVVEEIMEENIKVKLCNKDTLMRNMIEEKKSRETNETIDFESVDGTLCLDDDGTFSASGTFSVSVKRRR
ncbi:1593_t:CDS:2, partial [Racocetra persica]